jgi:outer membrane protein
MIRSLFLISVSSLVLFAGNVLTWERAYELALTNHPGYRVEKYKTQAVEESVRQAQSRLFPKIDISASGGKYEYETFYNTAETSEVYKTYSLSLVQPLFRPELWRTVDQMQKRYETSTTELKKQAQQVGVDVMKTYLQMLKTQADIDKLHTQKELYDAKFRKSADMIAMGLSNSVELIEAKVNKEKASIDLLAKKREYQTLKSKLERLCKTPFDSIAPIQSDREFSMSKEEWMNYLRENKDLKIARLSKKVAEDEVAIRNYDHYPKVDLSLGRSQNYTNDPVAHKYDNKAFVQLSFPIYQGGYTSSRVQEAVLLRNAAESNEELAQLQIQDKFEELWTQRESLHESIGVLKQALESSKLFLKSTRSGYEKGIKNQIDIMEAELKMKSVESELNISHHDMMINEVGLLDLTGRLGVENYQ